MNTPKYFSSYGKKHMPPFVVLKHCKWSNLTKQKSLKKSTYASHAWVISVDYLKSDAGRLKHKNNDSICTGLTTSRFKKVWKLREVFNVCVTAGNRPAQAQEEPAGWGPFSRFVWGHGIFLQNKVKILEFLGACNEMCKKSLGIYKKSSRKACSITTSRRS